MEIREMIQEYLDIENEYNISVDDWLKGVLEDLDSLTSRLQKDNRGEKKFEQEYNDEFSCYEICEFLSFLREKAIEELEE